jgi:hypothetical protein
MVENAHVLDTSGRGTEQILATLAQSDLTKFTSFFVRIRHAQPEEVTKICIRHISSHQLGEPEKQMATWLAAGTGYITLLFDPEFLTLEESRQAALVMRDADPLFFAKLSRLTDKGAQPELLLRLLVLLEALGDYSAILPRLCTLAWHEDKRIRSKAVMALCRLRPNPSLIKRQLDSPDYRVRANAIEALWYAQVDNAVRLFQAALADSHHRVVVNAVLGLYFHKDESYYSKVLELANHSTTLFRVATAWALGRMRDPRLLPILEGLTKDPSPQVRSKALESLAQLPALQSEPQPSDLASDQNAAASLNGECVTLGPDLAEAPGERMVE